MFSYALSEVLGELFALPFTASLLGAVLAHDYDTHHHLVHTGTLAARVGLAAGLDNAGAVVLGQAALFHDIGKVHVDRRVLTAPRPLCTSEWQAMRDHPGRGEAMLLEAGAPKLAAIVRSHHERIDGSGYPDGLRGGRIPWKSRLLAVVDAFDAMRSGRPYAPCVGHGEALARLANAPHLFDPDAVDALAAALRYPVVGEALPALP
ncbi:MAG TPA: HD domain-containing phosphohydrolase [Candidatus Baltobacteraceae bacterium]|nr:HD domain-containing phosphohydrolase [Candidatus Baltobacteraceae bacterium]